MYDRIKELRLQKGLSQQELARLAGYSDRSSIAKIESGVVDLPQSKIVLFAQVLGVEPSFLMGLEDPESSICTLRVSEHEKDLVLAYRANPSMQSAVDRLLGLDASPEPQSKHA